MQNVHREDAAWDSGLVDSNPCVGGGMDTVCMNGEGEGPEVQVARRAFHRVRSPLSDAFRGYAFLVGEVREEHGIDIGGKWLRWCWVDVEPEIAGACQLFAQEVLVRRSKVESSAPPVPSWGLIFVCRRAETGRRRYLGPWRLSSGRLADAGFAMLRRPPFVIDDGWLSSLLLRPARVALGGTARVGQVCSTKK